MSTTPRSSLLLALVVGSLVGPAAAAARPIYDRGEIPGNHVPMQAAQNAARPAASYYSAQALRAMGARGQAQAEFYSSAASHYTPLALRAMGARGQAQSEFYATPSVGSRAGQPSEATGDRWGADASKSGTAAHVERGVATSRSASNDGGNTLAYVLGAIGILLAVMAGLIGVSRRFHSDPKQRIAIP
jgi:hypothetical protein